MFRWITVSGDDAVYTDKIGIEVTEGRVWINEIALFDDDGNIIKSAASEGAEALVDEPEEIPATPSYLNGMYFDELYHGPHGLRAPARHSAIRELPSAARQDIHHAGNCHIRHERPSAGE